MQSLVTTLMSLKGHAVLEAVEIELHTCNSSGQKETRQLALFKAQLPFKRACQPLKQSLRYVVPSDVVLEFGPACSMADLTE